MKRWVYAHRTVNGAPEKLESTLRNQTITLLQAATESPADEPAADGSHIIRLPSKVAGLEIAKNVRVNLGAAYRVGSRTFLPITWHADPGRHLAPTFEGTLEVEPLSAHHAQLSLAGSYDTPLGPLGSAADSMFLRDVGQGTTEALVILLANELKNMLADPPRDAESERRSGPLTVGAVMSHDPLTLEENLPLRTAAMMLFHADVSGAPVVSARGELLGVLSEADLLVKAATQLLGFDRAAAAEDQRRSARTVGEAATRPARTTVVGAKLRDVARLMLDEEIKRLVVLDEGAIAGMLTRHDVLAALTREEADIEASVHAVVTGHDAEKVRIAVQMGDVTLTGTMRDRSGTERLSRAVGTVDGVMAVDSSNLEWEADDTVLGYRAGPI